MKKYIIFIIIVLLTCHELAFSQPKRALVIGLGQQEDRNWGKINGDKDVAYVQKMLKNINKPQKIEL